MRTAETQRTPTRGWVSLYGVKSSPARIVAVSLLGARFWDAETGEPLCEPHESDNLSYGAMEGTMAVSLDGRCVAAGTLNGAVDIWDLTTCSRMCRTEKHKDYERICAIEFTRNGSHIATAAFSGTIRIWETRTGELKQILGDRGEVVSNVAFKADTIKSMHCDGTACVWQASSQTANTPDKTFTGMISSTFMQVHDLGPNLLRVGESNPVKPGEVPAGHYPVCISSDGSLLGLCRDHDTVVILNRRTGELVTALPAMLWRHRSAIFSPDNRYMATSTEDGEALRVFDTTTGTVYMEMATPFPAPNALDTVAFSATSRLFAICRDDSKVLLWNLKSRKLIRTLDTGGEGIHAIAISPDETHIAVAVHYSETVRVMSLARSGKDVRLAGDSADILSLDYSSDGSMIVTGGDDGTVRLWHAESGKLLSTYVVFPDGSWAIFTPGGNCKCSPGAEQYLMWKAGVELEPVTSGKPEASL